jgi:hypothetical protein
MSFPKWCFGKTLLVVLGFGVLIESPSAVYADDPVTVSVEIEGDAMPLGTVTATATIDIMDGSTLEAVTWSHLSGVDAAISGADTDTVTVMLGAESEYKKELIHVLSEPPIGPDQLPPNVPLPDGEFPGGLQDRFQVVGINPFSLEEAGFVVLEVEVVTSSGTYHGEAEIHTALPWHTAAGIHNVPIGVPVLLHGKEQEHYSWQLSTPGGSGASLTDALGQSPEFTPDVSGRYSVSVNDLGTGGRTTLSMFAGTWKGIIEGQDSDGRPVVDSSCFGCHDDDTAPEVFTEWAQTGHAEILTNNLNTSTHYGPNCFDCHTVGFNPDADNGGIDDAPDYQAFLDSGLINNPGDNWTAMLDEFPHAARLANIQCENCHGPQSGGGHTNGNLRTNLSSNVCATCHGEPLRHARFQQWQLSAHANYELAIEEGGSGNCSRCHTGNGFLTWLPVLLGDAPGDPLDSIQVTWSSDEFHPQTCQTCHDPHNIGTTSGSDPNATVRISGDTPPLIAGFTATDVGRGAICMTCHNTRRGLRNDDTFDDFYLTSEAARAPHGGAQTDVLMGQNAYLVEVGERGYHSQLEDTCVDCHMEATPPPPDLSYNLGGTNHTFYARNDICGACHDFETADALQDEVYGDLMELQDLMEEGLFNLIDEQTEAGNVIDLDGEATIADAEEIGAIEFGETRGRQAMTVTFGNGSVVGPLRMSDIEVVPATGDPFDLYDVADPILIKSGWNWNLIHNDGSMGVHNSTFVEDILETSTIAIIDAGIAGGDGTGIGTIGCEADYSYWTEIAVNAQGRGSSEWRTDVAARNVGSADAEIDIILHTESGDASIEGVIAPSAQGVFEDVVGMMELEGKGSLHICSNQPLEVISRIYSVSDDGTFGQFFDGYPGGNGMSKGDTARLLGLRQVAGAFRTNISVTNTGMQTATALVTLYDTSGTELHSYNLKVAPGMVVQDLEPFKTRAGEANLGWGYATVEVVSGSGVLTSASVVDEVTNDATTIPMKR